ncbi:MAG: hypothetical protein ACREJN_21060 [Nitrospiraceae bacterium]
MKQSEMLEVGLRMLAFKARHDASPVLTSEQREKAKVAHPESDARDDEPPTGL